MGLWYYLIVVLLASVDFPVEFLVGDLSRLISGRLCNKQKLL
jgi:hypothetical protein